MYFDQRSIVDYVISSNRKMIQNVKVKSSIFLDSVPDLRILAEKLQTKEKEVR